MEIVVPIFVGFAVISCFGVLVRMTGVRISKIHTAFKAYLVLTSLLSMAIMAVPVLPNVLVVALVWLAIWFPVSAIALYFAPLRWCFVPLLSMSLACFVSFATAIGIEVRLYSIVSAAMPSILLASSLGSLYMIYRTSRRQPRMLGCGQDHNALSDEQATTGDG